MATVTVAINRTLVTDDGNFSPKSGPFQMNDSKAAILCAQGLVKYYEEPIATVTVDHSSNLDLDVSYKSEFGNGDIVIMDDGIELIPTADKFKDVLAENGIEGIAALSCKTVDELVKIKGIGKATAKLLLKEAKEFMVNR